MIAKFVSHSMQDVIDRLGVPAYRIGMNPPPGQATELDVIRYLEGEPRRLYELVDGILVEKPMVSPETMMADFVLHIVQNHAELEDLGLAYGGAGIIRVRVGNVRMPDVSFFSWDTLPNDKFPADPVCPVAPVLAVEVLSPSNSRKEMMIKRAELFPSGTKLMWIIDPKTRSAEIYTSPKKCKVIDAQGILDDGSVLPGFQLKLQDVFDSLQRRQSRMRKS